MSTKTAAQPSELDALKQRVAELEQTATQLIGQYNGRLAALERTAVMLTSNIAQLYESQNAILRVLNSEAA